MMVERCVLYCITVLYCTVLHYCSQYIAGLGFYRVDDRPYSGERELRGLIIHVRSSRPTPRVGQE